jgi:magnesium transporter
VAVDGTVALADVADVLGAPDTFVWLDAADPTVEDVGSLAAALGLHPLTIEDLSHRRQRPRAELFDRYAFVALRGLTLPDGQLLEQEVHAVAGEGFLATLRYGEHPYPIHEVEQRWQRQPELLRAHPSGFALYRLIDDVVDGYLTIIEALEDRTDDLEELVFADDPSSGGPEVQERIFRVKREVVRLRRYAAPLRQCLDLLQDAPAIVHPELLPYYRDVTEHAIRVAEFADNVREVLTSLVELRVAQVANHLNVAMRKLTAWAAILLAPTLIAGIYGMNFDAMPELGWRFGYGFALLLMGSVSVALYVMFKRKGWL